MASMLAPAMSDKDLLSAMVTHYEPRIQACLISANVKSTQEALAVLNKLHSLENSREQYRRHGGILNTRTKLGRHRAANLLKEQEIAGQMTVCKYTM
jgi:hypothetical protein